MKRFVRVKCHTVVRNSEDIKLARQFADSCGRAHVDPHPPQYKFYLNPFRSLGKDVH